ncbi:hypothetical protein JX266_002573 [Neoarthrinium moseri]|nr:hypothetical protein JX266_002573 [Neoarthrinium moseri]
MGSAQPSGTNVFTAPSAPAAQQSLTNPFAAAARKPSKSPFVDDAESPKPNPFSRTAAKPSLTDSQSNGAKQGGFNPPSGPKVTANAFTAKPTGASHGPSQVNGKRKSGPNITKPSTSKLGSRQQRPEPKSAPSEFAATIYKQLAKVGIKPPVWPSDPDALLQPKAMDNLRQAHRAYRDKAREALMKADLIDDPDKRRRLDQALPFKGICEEMCPEWEKITRITEKGVWKPEGAEDEDEDGQPRRIPIPKKMLKRLARSAAGQEAPLPMDVRSPAACRRTLDYLIDDLIASDDRLSTYHHFAWDRTRAIRIDLSMQTPSMSPEEIKHEVYCLETIARFHATSAHLLAQPSFAYESYSEQQEVEQLNKCLMTLRQRYKDCADMGIACENEAEFRAYYVLFFAWDPALKDIVESWGEISTSEAIQTALCVIEAMQNTTMAHGPLRPEAPTEIAVNVASMFFSIIASPQISYTMACIAEVHFGVVRQSILEMLIKSYSRPKGAPKDLTPEFLRRQLRFDSVEDAVAFAELQGLQFQEENGLRYLLVKPHQQLKKPRIPHSFSYDIVERKRCGRPFPDCVHETIFEEPGMTSNADVDEESMFVESTQANSNTSNNTTIQDSELEDTESLQAPPMASISPSAGGAAGPQHTSLGVNPGTSIFSQPGPEAQKAPAPSNSATGGSIFGSSPTVSLFGGLSQSGMSTNPAQGGPFSSLSTTQSIAKAPDTTDAAKKVTFGETQVKYIESRADVNSSSSSAPSGIFGFLGNDNKKPTAPAESTSSSASWFPSSLPGSSSKPGQMEGGSVLSGVSSTSGSSFKFPDSSTPPSGPLFGAAGNRSLSSPPVLTFPSTNQTPGETQLANQPPALDTTQATGSDGAKPMFTPNNTSEPSATTTNPLFPTTSTGGTATATSLFPPTTQLPPPKTQPKENPLDSLTRWFVCGDRGLMDDHLEEWAVETVLKDVWDNFQVKEEERKRKEEDERSWAEARKFRTYSLQVTYFYRWLEIFRKRRVVKRIQMEKEKFRQWKAPENVAKRKAEATEARETRQKEAISMLRRSAQGKATEEKKLRESTQSRSQSVEDALLASGILSGVRDERAAARDAVMDEEEPTGMLPSEMLYQQESKRREKHGLPPLSRLGHPRSQKEGTKTAKLRALAAGRDSLSMSTGSLRNSTFSSSYRSSQGFNSSRVAKPKKSRVSDPYWRMKAHGLVQMPNGEYLHESLALPMLREGKRFPGLGNFGIPATASETSPLSLPTNDELFEDSPPLPRERIRRSHVSRSPSVASNVSFKRKRLLHHDDTEDEDLAAYRSEASASLHKRVRSSGSMSNEPDLLAQMQSLLHDVEAEKAKHKA